MFPVKDFVKLQNNSLFQDVYRCMFNVLVKANEVNYFCTLWIKNSTKVLKTVHFISKVGVAKVMRLIVMLGGSIPCQELIKRQSCHHIEAKF